MDWVGGSSSGCDRCGRGELSLLRGCDRCERVFCQKCQVWKGGKEEREEGERGRRERNFLICSLTDLTLDEKSLS